MADVRALYSNIDDAVSILGGDDDYRRELLLFVLLHADPRDPIGEAIHAEVVARLYAVTDHGKAGLSEYKKMYSKTIFDQPGQDALQSRAQSS